MQNLQEALGKYLADHPEARTLEQKLDAARKRNKVRAFEDKPVCPVCRDLGVVTYDAPYGHPLFGKLQPCPAEACPTRDERRAERQAQLIRRSGIHESRMADWTFATWDTLVNNQGVMHGKREARAIAEMFCFEVDVTTGARLDWNYDHVVSLVQANRLAGRALNADGDILRNSIVLQGDYGLGKTGLTVAIAQACIEAGQQPLWIRWQDALEEIKDRMGKDEPPTVDDKTRAIEQAQVLIVDDLNMEIISEWRREQAERIFRYRNRKALPTIVTCNSTREQLEREWGRRAIEPLFEMAHYVRMGGDGLRDTMQIPDDVEPF